MRLLLDTDAVIWATAEPENLRPAARDAIAEPSNDVAFSASSVWEIAIKRAAGKLEMPSDFVDALLAHGFPALPITVAHALEAADLPSLHRDPFDRMLVAQARVEDRTLVTRDRRLAAYDVAILPA